MLPDFPRVKQPIVRSFNKVLRALVDADPILSQFQKERYWEGDTWGLYSPKDDVPGSSFREIRVPHALDKNELIERGPAQFVDALPELARASAAELRKNVLAKLEEAAQAGSPAASRLQMQSATCDDFIAMLESVEFSFDADGNPQGMTMMLEAKEDLAKVEAWHKDPECKKKYDELLQRKRDAFYARESDRKLVD